MKQDNADILAPDEHIAAILPIYDEHGRGVAVYTSGGGRRIYSLRLRTILTRLAERNCRTLPLIRRRMRLFLGGRQELPLPISPQLVLIPCKVIAPRVKGDETIGYFNLAHIRRLVLPPHSRPVPARGRGRAVMRVEGSRMTNARQEKEKHLDEPVQDRPSSCGQREAGHEPQPAARLHMPADSKSGAAAPAYELMDGRSILLFCTSATARQRLALAAYAKTCMFSDTAR